MKSAVVPIFAAVVLATSVIACGARSQLGIPDPAGSGEGGEGGSSGSSRRVSQGSGGEGGEGGEAPEPCEGVETRPCGSDVGECRPGVERCGEDGFFGPCIGEGVPRAELCNGLDEDCDGSVDEDFGVGQACDGPDNDSCLDDIMTCEGCSLGPDILEVCNGVDDNCNGIVDADCDVGGCAPTLLVTGSTPSSLGCVDLPVEAGSAGIIEYPCEGGAVTAQLGNILFTGSVEGGEVHLSGSEEIVGPDECIWRNDHFIDGSIPSGTVTYFYSETLIDASHGGCWSPCTETGSVDIDWIL